MTSTLRLLRLLSLLESRRFWTGPELAERLEVSTRTIRRDADRLRQLGYPVDAAAGPDGGYELRAGAALPPLVLDDAEAVALAVGVRMAALGVVDGIEDASVRALTKLTNVLPDRLRHQVHALGAATVPASWGNPGPLVDGDVLAALAAACRDGRRVGFRYTKAGASEGERRRADPHRLVALGRRWYLVAYDLDRRAWRSFRLDRLSAVVEAGEAAPLPEPPGDPAEFVRSGVRRATTSFTVHATVAADASTVRRNIGRWAEVTELDTDRCRLTMPADDLFWAAVGLAGAGGDLSEVEPPEVLAVVHDWGRRLSSAT